MEKKKTIREVVESDLDNMLDLYVQFHHTPKPAETEHIKDIWKSMIDGKGLHVLVGEENGKIVCSAQVMIVPNLTHGQRPFAIIENLITDEQYRRQGWATALLEYVKEMATEAGCYKVMLTTSSKDEGILQFYEDMGYYRNEKQAFIQWIY
jgi:ribosomal protein S18 acetylase RimI-like enzyme